MWSSATRMQNRRWRASCRSTRKGTSSWRCYPGASTRTAIFSIRPDRAGGGGSTMRGSMREKRPGYWQLRVFEGVDPVTGRKEYRTAVFRGTKREAQNALATLVTQVNAGAVKTRNCTVAELI